MKRNIIKNAILSFVILSLWISFPLFQFMFGKGRFIFFFYNLIIGGGIGFFALLFRLLIFKNSKSELIRRNPFYLFFAMFNLTFFAIWTIAILTKRIRICQDYIYILIAFNILISGLIFTDIIKSLRTQNSD
jgi:hypothetical protein